MRNKLRSFEALIDGVSFDNCDYLVENFHKNIEEHLQSELHHYKKVV